MVVNETYKSPTPKPAPIYALFAVYNGRVHEMRGPASELSPVLEELAETEISEKHPQALVEFRVDDNTEYLLTLGMIQQYLAEEILRLTSDENNKRNS